MDLGQYMHKNNLTWGLMSKFSRSPKNVPLSYYTVMDFGRFGTALSRNIKRIRVEASMNCIPIPTTAVHQGGCNDFMSSVTLFWVNGYKSLRLEGSHTHINPHAQFLGLNAAHSKQLVTCRNRKLCFLKSDTASTNSML